MTFNKKELKSFFSFFLTAVGGALVNFLSQIPFKNWFDTLAIPFPLQWSIFAGYMLATVVSFLPQRNLVFGNKDSGTVNREITKYIIIALLALGIQEICTTWAMKYISDVFLRTESDLFRMKAAHVIGMGFSFLANYYGHKLLTFRSTGLYDSLFGKK